MLFDPQLFRCHTATLGKLFTHMFTKQYKLIPTETMTIWIWEGNHWPSRKWWQPTAGFI